MFAANATVVNMLQVNKHCTELNSNTINSGFVKTKKYLSLYQLY